jgi:hypothetical protein
MIEQLVPAPWASMAMRLLQRPDAIEQLWLVVLRTPTLVDILQASIHWAL